MPEPFKTQLALVKAENRERVADAAERLEQIMHELDAIGPMLGCAHLSHAIETLKAMVADSAFDQAV